MQLVKYRYTRVNQQAENIVNTVLVRVFSFKKVVKLVYGEGEHKLDWRGWYLLIGCQAQKPFRFSWRPK